METVRPKYFEERNRIVQSPKDEEERKNGVRTIAPYGVCLGWRRWAVLKDETDGRYHMFAAEMTEHCGIGAWAP